MQVLSLLMMGKLLELEKTTYIIVKCDNLQAKIKVIVTEKRGEGYTVLWLNYNYEVLEVDLNVLEGASYI